MAFHSMGRTKPERCLFAGNQQGKSTAGGAETYYHLSGNYPDWWTGYRFSKPIEAWAAGPTGKKTRDNPQAKLLGKRRRWGTGFIPRSMISADPVMARGTPGLVDYVKIKHVSGGESIISFMTYDMDVEAWQSDTLDLIWFDEEPPEPHYEEGGARFTATEGISYITATPLKGMSSVVSHFYPRPDTPERGMVRMELADALHLPPERHERILRRFASHQRMARSRGIPVLGSGNVYSTPEEAIKVPAFAPPVHWGRIIGLDLGGGTHPCAFVDVRWDRDSQIAYLVNCYKQHDPRISTHASAIKSMAGQTPVAWPHDAGVHSREGDGLTYAQLFRKEGVNMLPTNATLETGGNSVEASVLLVDQMLSGSSLLVFDHLSDFFDEYRTYHRKNGIIVKREDDLMDALRYAIMMLRFSKAWTRTTAKLPQTVGMSYNPLAPQRESR